MKIFARISLLFVWLVIVTSAVSSYAQKLPFVNYSTAQGMVHNRTHTINQDAKGYIWIGTDLGINRYDGRNFKHYPAPDNKYYFARYSGRAGDHVLFAMDGMGIALCLEDSVQFIYPGDMKPMNINGVVPLPDGKFLFNEWQRGVVQMDRNGKTQVYNIPGYTNGNAFVDMFRDSKGIIWLMSGSGLIVFPEQSPQLAKKFAALGNAYINCVREHKDGYIYIASSKGVHRILPGQRQYLSQAAIEPVFQRKQEVTSITFDHQNNVWLSTVYDGVYKCSADGSNQEHYTLDNGLISKNTWSTFCDRENNIWIGSENGISKLPDHQFINFDFSQYDFQHVKNGLRWDDSTILLSNVIDIYRVCGSKIQKIKGFHSNFVGYRSHILDKSPDGRLWVNICKPLPTGDFSVRTLSFLLKGDRVTDAIAVSKLPGGPNEILGGRGFVDVPGGGILMCSDRGMKVYRSGRFFPVSRPDKENINAICGPSSESFWALKNHNRLTRYKLVSSTPNQDSFSLTVTEQPDSSVLRGRQMHHLFRDSRNRIWCYSIQAGLIILNLNADGSLHHSYLPPLSDFSSEIINNISEDTRGHIWVATAAGLDEMEEQANGWQVKKDRFGGLLCGKNIFFVQPFNRGLITGTTGCAAYIGLQETEAPGKPEVYLTGIRINEKSRQDILYRKNPVLSSDQDNIRFSFTGIYFKDERRIRYAYLLEGLEEKWSSPSTEYMVTYSHLPPGDYTFHVKALAPDGLWSAKEAAFSFSIDQPFYTSWWFILLCTGACSVILYSVYRYRIDQLLAIQHIRQSISKDLHDDIGATVSSISILASMANSDLVSEHKRRQFLESIQDESKHVTESLSDIVWSINPKNDTLEIMFARMQRYASELFEAKNISYTFSLPSDTSNISIPMNQRQQVYLIFKEAVNNLAKYAGNCEASISLMVSDEIFTMQICDNGLGFDQMHVTPGNGIINMRKRAQEAGALLEINSQPGSGTQIHFTLHL